MSGLRLDQARMLSIESGNWHSECQSPDSIDNILAWGTLKPETRKKLLWDNAARFYKRT